MTGQGCARGGVGWHCPGKLTIVAFALYVLHLFKHGVNLLHIDIGVFVEHRRATVQLEATAGSSTTFGGTTGEADAA